MLGRDAMGIGFAFTDIVVWADAELDVPLHFTA